MKFNNTRSLKIPILCLLISFMLLLACQSQSQDLTYDSKGNPDKWNFSITPFFIMPWVNGEIQSKRLSEEFGVDPSQFINSLNATFMVNAEISRGKFFAAPSYIYNYNEVEAILWSSDIGEQSIIAKPAYQRHIFEFIAGMRFRLASKFILDPFVGFRYTHYRLFGEIDGIGNNREFDEKEDFWDPILGFKAHYYPHPKVPIELKADIGGFGAGSKLTWSAWFNSGYTVSRVVDILAGFGTLSNEYESESRTGNTYGMTSITYGVTLGARFYIPGRAKDPAVFKKKYKR